ncbi:ABC transporter permease [Gemella morbillorum]|uniref:ABC transporter permease n=1 Tax=Gemella morbillorum TaxID=29391 RepID=UPI00254BEF18|nr:ABC transporter permease [Gemella morbillorum]MDK8239021.1 ABC transporter permease [Gemella morbillorum]MDK8254578.1 ABC transporter permease [Gemella morbillorum]
MNLFYSKFALNNLVKNKRFILPYIFSAIFTIASFYILTSLSLGSNLDKLPQGISATKQVLSLGVIVIAIFSAIFLFYTYSFLIKRRVREFGLYSVLGMTKKQIARILILETIFIGVLTLVFGLAFGLLFDKLMLLVLLKLFTAGVSFGFVITPIAVFLTILLFGGIFFLLLIYTVIKISRLKIVALLKEENNGEREPKARFILAILGLGLTGYGYYLAQTIQNPIKAITMFFVAVLAVIFGTYLIFMAVSITVLKLMKNNKTFYYKPKNFISVSGLLYRMKRNAVGLANICILSTMVLVTMGTTSALYAGSEEAYNTRFPRDIIVNGYRSTEGKLTEIEKNVKKATQDAGVEAKDLVSYNMLNVVGRLNGTEISYETGNVGSLDKLRTVVVIELKDYNKVSKEQKTLNTGETLLFIDKKGKYEANEITVQGVNLKIKEKLTDFPGALGTAAANAFDTYYVVVKDNTDVKKIESALKKKLNMSDEEGEVYNYVGFNISDKTKEAKVIENFKQLEKEGNINIEGKAENETNFKGFYASFLFIGVFISMIFVVSQVVIMYYKQISEGYEDKGKFGIMRKVGLTDRQIKQSIRSQVLMIFFAPLAIATLHTVVAYPFIEKILKLFLATDNNVFLIALAVTIAVFGVFYLIVYLITSRIYYRIIKE